MAAKKVVLLFDVDGTLTLPRKKIESWMRDFMIDLRKKVTVGVVGGSDLCKVVEQLGDSVEEVTSSYDYVFTENGLVSFRKGQRIPSVDIRKQIPEKHLQRLLNWSFGYMSNLELPCKRGSFVEFRRGMINISPIGRSCSYEERLEFVKYDTENNVRNEFIDAMRKAFPPEDYGLHFSIGGQISIDIFPLGWDKRFCLQYVIEDEFDEIHFFGDKVLQGGNDHEIYEDPSTIGHCVKAPADTKAQVEKLLPSIL